MKLFLVLGVLVSAYAYLLMQTTDTVLFQTQHLNAAYQYVAANSDKIAGQ